MRIIRLLSQDTYRLRSTMANPAPSPPRRITRSSLARFAYVNGKASLSTSASSPDIEDVIPNTASTSAASRKRKRATTTTASVATTKTAATTTPSPPPRKPRKIKPEKEEEPDDEPKKPAPPPKRQRKPARPTTDPATGHTTITPPSDWEAVYAAVQRMRLPGGAAYPAAVDTMGCERLADRGASARDQRFQTLVALMLSSQTKDTVNAAAMRNLQTRLGGAPPGLNLENMLAVSPADLDALIRAVGFHNNKTRYLKRAAELLRDEWAGDIPPTVDGLVSLPGVGPKMAHLCMSAAWGRTEGIGVDVHVHRITNLWRWHRTRDPEGTRAALESWLPREKWREINGLLVGLGQTVCLPGPGSRGRCGECEVGLEGLCPAADRAKVAEGRRRREEEKGVKAEIEVGEEEEGKEGLAMKVEVEDKVLVKKEEEE
ncbi:DNA glycosylase [Camillea tinctor]|nr:DNA glycosylase [Camillea tinctor]